MGWAGLQIVWMGRSSSTADESGALTGIASSLGGRAVLWVAFLGFAVVALWNLSRGLTGRHCRTGRKRLEHAADGLTYVTVAWSAAAFAVATGQTSRDSTMTITRTLLALPAGVLLVVGTGIAVAGVGAFSVWSGVSRDFLLDLAQRPARLVIGVGILGFVARGVVYGLVGVLFLVAAWTHDVDRSTGIDGALRVLQERAGRRGGARAPLGRTGGLRGLPHDPGPAPARLSGRDGSQTGGGISPEPRGTRVGATTTCRGAGVAADPVEDHLGSPSARCDRRPGG